MTGCFLTVSTMSYFLNEAGVVAYQQLIPLATGLAKACVDPCVCDADGAIAGLTTNIDGGCSVRDTVGTVEGFINKVSDTGSMPPLCLVPADCDDSRVANTTAAIIQLSGDTAWVQPATHHFRICSLSEPVSDICDPGSEQVRSNMYSFTVVFVVSQIAVSCAY